MESCRKTLTGGSCIIGIIDKEIKEIREIAIVTNK